MNSQQLFHSFVGALSKTQAESLERLHRAKYQKSVSASAQESISKAREDAPATRARCRSLVTFVREAWPHIPGLADVKYIEGWHIALICAHLEAITSGKLLRMGLQNRLLVNVPSGAMKSLLISVFWPAWEWTMFPHYQYITTSYREDYCTRDTSRMRDLVTSDWYQLLWGQNRELADGSVVRGVKMVAIGETRISNSSGGWREGVPFGSLTGNRADRVIIDDPHSIDTAESDAQRARTTLRFRESVPYRINNPIKSAIVVVMQRLHVNDISGVITQLKLPYIHIMLPMEFESERRCVTPIGKDPRMVEGELMFPQRFPREVVERDKIPLGPNGIAGQLQQRPYARGGAMFKAGWFSTVPAAPKGTKWVRHWDLAATKRKAASIGGAWTAGVKLGKDSEGTYYVGHVHRLQDEGDEVRKAIRLVAEVDGKGVEISLPQDPGQAGKVQARDMVRMLDGYRVRAVPETGDKVTRAEPFQAQAAAGNVKIIKTGDSTKDAWIQPYVDEIVAFPGSPTKDQVDASSGAYAALQRGRMDHVNGDIGGAPVRTEGGFGPVAGIDRLGHSPDAVFDRGGSPDAVFDRGGRFF